jgi:hypothetical protein
VEEVKELIESFGLSVLCIPDISNAMDGHIDEVVSPLSTGGIPVENDTHPLDAVQGFMLLRHGNVAAEGWWAPYGPESPHSLYSLSKSFTSSGIGLAVAEGRLTVDDPVLKFFPDDAPAKPGKNLKAMRVRHLLSMNTGHKEDTTRHVFRGEVDNWARVFLSLPVKYQPGTWFVYNTAATYMLSAIITKLTGESLLDYHVGVLDPLASRTPGDGPRDNIGGLHQDGGNRPWSDVSAKGRVAGETHRTGGMDRRGNEGYFR